ncbi:MAG: MFS transporter [Chloroflexota bacterium]|nr:MFS transporter [Chloroflexota bacterium]
MQPQEPQQPLPLEQPTLEVTTTEQARITTFTSLRNRNFLWLWLSTVAFFGGIQMQVVARGWLVYEITSSPLALGMVSAAFGLPVLLFSLYGGTIADRVAKRNLIIVSQAANGVVTLVIAVLIATDKIVLWHLVAAAAASGAAFIFIAPARMALISDLVTPRELLNAIALSSTGTNLTRVIAPAVAGALLAVIGIAGVYYLVVFFYILSIVWVYLIPAGEAAVRQVRTSVWADIVEGVRYLRHSPVMALLLLMAFIPIVFGMPYQNLMPVFAVDVLDVGETGLGLLMSMTGVGALAGSLGVASLGDFKKKGLLLIVLGVVFGVTLAVFGFSHSYSLSLVTLVAVGLANAAYMTVNNTMVQSSAPPEVRGRVMAIFMVTFALMPLGTLPIGAVAEAVGPTAAVSGGALAVLVFIVAIAVLRPRVRRLE